MALKHRTFPGLFVFIVFSAAIMTAWYYGSSNSVRNSYNGFKTHEHDSPKGYNANSNRKASNLHNVDKFRKVSGLFGKGTGNKFSNEDFFRNDSVYINITCKSDVRMTDTDTSGLTLLDWNVNTNEVKVLISARNGRNQERTTGGDVIVIWAEQVDGDGRVPGKVTDQWNGKYIGTVGIFWSGQTVIKAKLLSTIENMCLRRNSLKKYGNTVYAMKNSWGIKAHYKNNSKSYTERCGVDSSIYGLKRLCNFTERNDGKHWYCGAPPTATLSCEDIYNFKSTGYNRQLILPNQDKSEVILQPGHGVFTNSIRLPPTRYVRMVMGEPLCSIHPRIKSWTEDEPSGYVFNNSWHVIGCKAPVPFTVESYRRCLVNKHVYIMGDSTLRQYVDYLVTTVLALEGPKLVYINGMPYRKNMHFQNYNITVDFKRHEMPYHFTNVSPFGIISLPSYIDEITSSDTSGQLGILLFGINTHFQDFSPEEFDIRIRCLSQAIKRLLKKKTKFTVLIKGPHITITDGKWFDGRISLLYRDIIYKHFNDMKHRVIYLDTWSISVAHNSELLHPIGSALRSQIQQFMTYVCSPPHYQKIHSMIRT